MSSQIVKDLADALRGIVVGRAKTYLREEVAGRADFLEDRALRLAELTVDMARAATEDDRLAMRASMESVTDTMEITLLSAAVDASAEARSVFKAVLGTALDFAEKALPFVVKAVTGI